MKNTPLTERQAEVAAKVASGLQTKAIAKELGITPETVRAHVREAAAKIPGSASPRHRLTVWSLRGSEGE